MLFECLNLFISLFFCQFDFTWVYLLSMASSDDVYFIHVLLFDSVVFDQLMIYLMLRTFIHWFNCNFFVFAFVDIPISV